MARIRSINPGMGESRDISKISFAARYFFALLWCHLDDEGRAEWLPRKLVGAMYSHDEEVDAEVLNSWRDECVKARLLDMYEVGGITYVSSPTFKVYQKPNKPQESKIPDVNGTLPDNYGSPTVVLRDDIGPGEEKRRGVGEGEKEGAVAPGKVNGTRFLKPTDGEVEAYMSEREWPNPKTNSQQFCDHYETKGWKVGKEGMKDWRACVRTWENRMKNDGKWNVGTRKKELWEDTI